MRRHNTPIFVIYLIYLGALAMTTALLVFWVLVVQRFTFEINQLVSKLGVEWTNFHWFVQTSGAGLCFLVIVALTYLLAITLSERRYRVKQEHFLSTITHELKSPVAAIRLHAQTLQQGGVDDEELGLFTGYIVKETERIGTLVDDLLESSRLSAGQGTELRPIHLGEFFREYQEAVRSRFDLQQVDLHFEVQTRSVVMATSETLQRVLDNLIDNALRFTEAGGRISLSVRDRNDDAEIVVSDTGVGIPRTELTKVFDRFYRLRREIEGRKKGTGLGLAIVRGLVEEMRGKIRAISGDEQEGTRFEIHLPQVRDDGDLPLDPTPIDAPKNSQQSTEDKS